MRLRQLTGLMQDQLHAEYEEVMKQIAYYEEILSNDELCKKVIKDELLEVKAKYGDVRRSEIVYSSEEFNPEDFTQMTKWLLLFHIWDTSSVHRYLNSVLKIEEE